MNDKKKPAHEIRLGRIKAVIWSNGTKNGERYNVQLKRLYRLAESEPPKNDSGWRETDSMGRDDLLLVAKLADLAHSWMHEQHGSAENKEAA